MVGEISPRQSGPPSQKRIFLLFSRTMFMGTMGLPVTGLAGVLITGPKTPPLTVRIVTLPVAVFPLVSVALALMVCWPSAKILTVPGHLVGPRSDRVAHVSPVHRELDARHPDIVAGIRREGERASEAAVVRGPG